MSTVDTSCRPWPSPEPPLSPCLDTAGLLSLFFYQFSLPSLLCYEQNFLFGPVSKTPRGMSIMSEWPSYYRPENHITTIFTGNALNITCKWVETTCGAYIKALLFSCLSDMFQLPGVQGPNFGLELAEKFLLDDIVGVFGPGRPFVENFLPESRVQLAELIVWCSWAQRGDTRGHPQFVRPECFFGVFLRHNNLNFLFWATRIRANNVLQRELYESSTEFAVFGQFLDPPGNHPRGAIFPTVD